MYGIRITINGSIGWIVGKDSDVLLFPDKAAASTALKRLKSGDAYSWNCEAERSKPQRRLTLWQ